MNAQNGTERKNKPIKCDQLKVEKQQKKIVLN